jgi:ankyrin repeat protein
MLVKAGLAQSRSEAAAQFVAIGIHSADQLLAKASRLADNLQQLKGELLSAIKAKDVAGAKAVLEQNPELLRGWAREGETPVLMSVYSGANELTQWLLERGVELSVHEAVAIGDLHRVIQFLDADPALIRVPSHDGWTLLHMASYFGHADIVHLLLSRGADVNERSANDLNNTPLHSALAGRRFAIAQLLVEHETDVNASNRRGWTALHLAASAGNLDMVKYLMQHGAKAGLRNVDGLTPADLALERGYPTVTDWLSNRPKTKRSTRPASHHLVHKTKGVGVSAKMKSGAKRLM